LKRMTTMRWSRRRENETSVECLDGAKLLPKEGAGSKVGVAADLQEGLRGGVLARTGASEGLCCCDRRRGRFCDKNVAFLLEHVRLYGQFSQPNSTSIKT
jgi:hypothetical protein